MNCILSYPELCFHAIFIVIMCVIFIQLTEMEQVGEETLVLAVNRPTGKFRMFGTNRGLAYGNTHMIDVGSGFLQFVSGTLALSMLTWLLFQDYYCH